MTGPDVPFDVQTDNHDLDHPVFKIKYRSNSIASDAVSTSSWDEKLPVVKVLGTGGTIASKGASASQTAGYHVDLTIEDLIKSIPDLSHTCELQFEQVFNLDLKEFGTDELLRLRKKVVEDLPHYDGIVITHGTDTCEETAFFLESTIVTDKPIVMCGSMRPSSSISSDGEMNLYQACVVAAHRNSRRRGVIITLNDKIGLGFYITKSDANSLDTFKSLGQGYLGNFVNNEVHYYFPPSRPSGLKKFTMLSDNLANIPILYAHQGFDNKLVDFVVTQLKAPGVVFATMGAGSLADATNKHLAELSTKYQIPVIYSKRSMDGSVTKGSLPKLPNNEYLVAGGCLNPQKARILLQLCLNEGGTIHDIRRAFDGVYGG